MRHFKSGMVDARGGLLRYVVEPSSGWNKIAEYRVTEDGSKCEKSDIDSFKTRKQADMTARHMDAAYSAGWRDATGGWPDFEDSGLRAHDVALHHGMHCPEHFDDPSSTNPETIAAMRKREQGCEFCMTITRIIETRNRLRDLARQFRDQLQSYDEKRGKYRTE